MAKLKKKYEQEEPIPMAPMIDMVFLLLVFFMTVSTVAQAQKTKAVDLPESETASISDDQSGRGIITVDADGKYYIGETELSIDELQQRIEQQLKKNPRLKLEVRADLQTEFGAIKRALKACAEVGAYDIIYATHQKRI